MIVSKECETYFEFEEISLKRIIILDKYFIAKIAFNNYLVNVSQINQEGHLQDSWFKKHYFKSGFYVDRENSLTEEKIKT